ncbi:hypothetical protein [Streptomyces albidoflavus]|uniref:hypothetical protein n=1 Tax=Streptomyces albidoflavus TaxID=1886 RepID=UPI0010225DD5|nr:hypothetical protein [Streptomyces albidoflavus]
MTHPPLNGYKKLQEIAENAPAGLSVWNSGTTALHALLASVSVRYLREVHKGSPSARNSEDGEPGGETRDWANMTAQLIEWAFRYCDSSISNEPTLEQVDEALDLAQNWGVIDIGLEGGKAGRVRVEQKGKEILIDPIANPSIEVLDMLLEEIDTKNVDENLAGPSLEPAYEYFSAQQGRRNVHKNLPPWIGGLYIQHMKNYVSNKPWEMPLDTDLGGLTLREAIPLMGTLKGMSFLQLTLFRGEPNLETAYLAMRPETLTRWLKRYNPKSSVIDKFIDLFTYRGPGGKTPFSAPIIPWDGQLVMPFALLADGLEERMIIRAAASNPSSSGKLGMSLGRLGNKWASRLGEIPGVKVATEVKVLAQNRRKIGDLDIAALDPDGKSGLIVEAKWPIDARVLADAWKQEAAIDKGREQIERLKAEISDGAIVKLPQGWPQFSDVEWTWIVGTARYLDPRRYSDGPSVTCLRLIEQLLPATSVNELLQRLKNFPYPREGTEFSLSWKRVVVGGVTVKARMIELLATTPRVPTDRRRSRGWT